MAAGDNGDLRDRQEHDVAGAGRFCELGQIEVVDLLAERLDDPMLGAKSAVAVFQDKDKGEVQRRRQPGGGIDLDLQRRIVAGKIDLAVGRLPGGIAHHEIDIGVGRQRHRFVPCQRMITRRAGG